MVNAEKQVRCLVWPERQLQPESTTNTAEYSR